MSTNDVNGYIKQHVEQLPQESLDESIDKINQLTKEIGRI